MKTSVLAVLALSLLASDAFVSPVAKNVNTALESLRGPQSGGTEGSSFMPDQYGTVGVDSPWGNKHPTTGYVAPPKKSGGGVVRDDMPLARGQILEVTGGQEGSQKFVQKGSATKWADTKWVEPVVQREDAEKWAGKKPAALAGSLMPAVASMAKGVILEATGGSLGSTKFLGKGSATKWADTKWAEPIVQRDDAANFGK